MPETAPGASRDIYRYDSGPRGFKRAALLLVFVAALVAVVGMVFVWSTFYR